MLIFAKLRTHTQSHENIIRSSGARNRIIVVEDTITVPGKVDYHSYTTVTHELKENLKQNVILDSIFCDSYFDATIVPLSIVGRTDIDTVPIIKWLSVRLLSLEVAFKLQIVWAVQVHTLR